MANLLSRRARSAVVVDDVIVMGGDLFHISFVLFFPDDQRVSIPRLFIDVAGINFFFFLFADFFLWTRRHR